MGKPTDPILTRPGAPSNSVEIESDAVSLHTQGAFSPGEQAPAFNLGDNTPALPTDDLPPLYQDIDSDNAPLLPSHTQFNNNANLISHKAVDENSGAEFFLTSFFEEDPKLLEKQISISAKKPPRPYVKIFGSHTQTVEENGKRQKKSITDFDVLIDLTPYLFSDPVNLVSWQETRTVENNEKARRGTVLKKRAPGSKQDVELSISPKPTLLEWCHRYCASHAGVKCFTLKRRVVGFNEEKVKNYFMRLVRSTNYRGHVNICFPVRDEYVFIYNNCAINRWRLTKWIVWLFYLTFLWIFSWPFLFFRTKNFEVVTSDWHYSKPQPDGTVSYVSMSEDHFYNTWARAVSRAVMAKRQAVLDHADLVASHTGGPDVVDAVLDAFEAPGYLRNGIQASVQAITAVNRQRGWGADEC
ncbi:hypothetical protein QBC35DRAFT_455219 [Podospora australis]|uniref:Uncharacterized protein n=1 Tax=Podospora australis TaxID=1536484 RepID=A0AAN7AFA6_9PEZI|nr:hypothetical protein QBC35DRAFT_455219 [Podospora australis]